MMTMFIVQALPQMLAFSLWPLITVIYSVGLLALHVVFALAVFNDANRLQLSGKDLFLVGPAVWALAVLLGGLPGVALYWLVHYYSRLQNKSPQVAATRPPDLAPSPQSASGEEAPIALTLGAASAEAAELLFVV